MEWQSLVAYVLLLLAAGYLLQKLVGTFSGKKTSGCSACDPGSMKSVENKKGA
ncbi:MAG: hypothetical protein KBA16_03375 [Bacteroidia bacterium]|jgi:hypothetical protein|uniref:hypothetical protein n=1 Tax=Candidatus Pollutiaquabacter sp. TaxID=3416354 RepID=UPI001A5872C9|nr:hypothetical protein [Bacteroidota bacterium]MBL7949568.1 hypothetical protein [Bacteroidia bacterium]MBP6009181.1 hypothetical protein [Bacteroidia bacterium]MBP7270577.1 hypothetical protein [Bacteroidia bacterium]MBP7436740.1 hypothetical protein [Bacteroidia bacterium]